MIISIIGSPATCQTSYSVSLSKVNTRPGVPLLQVYHKAQCLARFYFDIHTRYNNITSGISHFVDDNMIDIPSNNSARNDEILSADLKKLEEWANQWLVKFSPSKSCDKTLAHEEAKNPIT